MLTGSRRARVGVPGSAGQAHAVRAPVVGAQRYTVEARMAYHLGTRIFIADYDPLWPQLYVTEQQCLLAVLAPIVLQIDHIGSTAVPGLAAKPIIDISVAVRERAALTPFVEALRGLGYEEIPIAPALQRRLLSKGPYNEGTHHVHVTAYGSDVG